MKRLLLSILIYAASSATFAQSIPIEQSEVSALGQLAVLIPQPKIIHDEEQKMQFVGAVVAALRETELHCIYNKILPQNIYTYSHNAEELKFDGSGAQPVITIIRFFDPRNRSVQTVMKFTSDPTYKTIVRVDYTVETLIPVNYQTVEPLRNPKVEMVYAAEPTLSDTCVKVVHHEPKR